MVLILLASLAFAQQETRIDGVLEVLSVDSDSLCPDVPRGFVPGVMRTTAGLAVHRGDGSYAHVCPDRWGAEGDGPAASDPSGRELYMLADGVVYRSTNSGCQVLQAEQPDGFVAHAVRYWRSAFWVLGRAAGGVGGALWRYDEGGASTVITRWTDFTPDGFAPEGNDHLWVGGIAGQQVRRLRFLGGLGDDEPLDIPTGDLRDVEFIRPIAAFDGEAWIQLRRRNQSWLWHARVLSGSAGTNIVFEEDPVRASALHGPILQQGVWVMVRNLKLHSALRLSGEWRDTGFDAPWTCLTQVGDRGFACTLRTLYAFERFSEEGEPTLAEVFSWPQLGEPEPACGAADACDASWSALADRLGRDADAPVAVCPDGRTAASFADDGCACNGSAGAKMTVWMLLTGFFARFRRRRDVVAVAFRARGGHNS